AGAACAACACAPCVPPGVPARDASSIATIMAVGLMERSPRGVDRTMPSARPGVRHPASGPGQSSRTPGSAHGRPCPVPGRNRAGSERRAAPRARRGPPGDGPEPSLPGARSRSPLMRTTMFERVGGFATVRLVVSEFYGRVLESELLRGHFDGVDMRRLIDHQTRLIAALMGGPASFTEEQLARAHQRLGITSEEFDEMTDLLRETLDDAGFVDDDVRTLCERVGALRQYVVAGIGSRAG